MGLIREMRLRFIKQVNEKEGETNPENDFLKRVYNFLKKRKLLWMFYIISWVIEIALFFVVIFVMLYINIVLLNMVSLKIFGKPIVSHENSEQTNRNSEETNKVKVYPPKPYLWVGGEYETKESKETKEYETKEYETKESKERVKQRMQKIIFLPDTTEAYSIDLKGSFWNSSRVNFTLHNGMLMSYGQDASKYKGYEAGVMSLIGDTLNGLKGGLYEIIIIGDSVKLRKVVIDTTK